MELRDSISEHRRAAGLTQEELAEKYGVSRQTVGKWEQGKAIPELDKLIMLCDIFGCTLDDLTSEIPGVSVSHTPISFNKLAIVFTAGIWIILTSLSFLSLLIGPSSVENIEVRRVAVVMIIAGILAGAVIIITACFLRHKWRNFLAHNNKSIKKLVIASIITLVFAAAIIFCIYTIAPGLRIVTFICLEISLIALFPIMYTIVLARLAVK
ncbi:MAG: helix-turn-helix transcriptional regulator [Coriobacteriales bacterium]|nr:helix-turn-helix transcriptional regulator [Coriobacteriales bacterium]